MVTLGPEDAQKLYCYHPVRSIFTGGGHSYIKEIKMMYLMRGLDDNVQPILKTNYL